MEIKLDILCRNCGQKLEINNAESETGDGIDGFEMAVMVEKCDCD